MESYLFKIHSAFQTVINISLAWALLVKCTAQGGTQFLAGNTEEAWRQVPRETGPPWPRRRYLHLRTLSRAIVTDSQIREWRLQENRGSCLQPTRTQEAPSLPSGRSSWMWLLLLWPERTAHLASDSRRLRFPRIWLFSFFLISQ